jgi:hypothetical protein
VPQSVQPASLPPAGFIRTVFVAVVSKIALWAAGKPVEITSAKVMNAPRIKEKNRLSNLI